MIAFAGVNQPSTREKSAIILNIFRICERILSLFLRIFISGSLISTFSKKASMGLGRLESAVMASVNWSFLIEDHISGILVVMTWMSSMSSVLVLRSNMAGASVYFV